MSLEVLLNPFVVGGTSVIHDNLSTGLCVALEKGNMELEHNRRTRSLMQQIGPYKALVFQCVATTPVVFAVGAGLYLLDNTLGIENNDVNFHKVALYGYGVMHHGAAIWNYGAMLIRAVLPDDLKRHHL